MSNILAALADPTVHGIYMAICFAVMVVPAIALAWWYHANINRSEGGRALMKRHNEIGVSHRLVDVGRMVAGADEMNTDLNAGRYGKHARQMQHRVYAMVGAWLVVLVVMFGILIWADEVNRTAG